MPNYLQITGLTQEEFDALFEENGDVRVAAEFKAREFAGSLQRLGLEREDFIQEMMCKFLVALPTFQSKKAKISTFAQSVMFRYSTKYIRDQEAECRDPRGSRPISHCGRHPDRSRPPQSCQTPPRRSEVIPGSRAAVLSGGGTSG